MYKANLGLLTGRYSDFERRMLEALVQGGGASSIRLPVGYRPLLLYLIKDGIITEPKLDTRFAHALAGDVPVMGFEQYDLTDYGRDFLTAYASAQSLVSDHELE